ncbi:MAG: hypothetical protein JWM68_3593 [Verrucomicrobiales bacterium]|nr:hypothetical protein [Verrucomicrobiales bacterium]
MFRFLYSLALVFFISESLHALEPIPDKLVVLTFDDSVASQYYNVRPLLKRLGFGATFFISEGFSFPTNKVDYMTWEQIAELNRDGFEIGNHTRDHLAVSTRTLNQLKEQTEAINAKCAAYGIPKPTSFAYPGNTIQLEALPLLRELGFKFARRGGAPEHPYEWGRGFAYEPGKDHPLLIPAAGDARPDWSLPDFERAVSQAAHGRIAVIQFHGVPDRDHPWVHTPLEQFTQYMDYLAAHQFKVIALRDLNRFVDPDAVPEDPFAIIKQRQASRTEVVVQGEVLDDESGRPLACRLSIQGTNQVWHFAKSASITGSAIRYERRNGASREMHTTLSAHPFRVELTPGKYIFTIHRGKEYLPLRQEVEIGTAAKPISFKLRRWIDMNALGWYSGDAHNHRNPADLPNVLLAEDLNVALPMVDWTTDAAVPPTKSGKGFPGDYLAAPQMIDRTHLWYPRNTEYEIFRAFQTNHTLGALIILNHQTRFEEPALPIRDVVRKAKAEGALIDLEKHNWPWSIALYPIAQVDLFELGNNHHWETTYGIRNWSVPAPAWMNLKGSGTDSELDWTLYGFQTYYALLNAGFRLKPSAGTANGVHPVPLGFSRVYVHVDGEFSYQKWISGLKQGHSFVTTGPMLFSTMDQKLPGAIASGESTVARQLVCSVESEHPLKTIELIVNGQIEKTFHPDNQSRTNGGYANRVQMTFQPKKTSWIAWRCFEDAPNNRIRFAHSAPSYCEIPGTTLAPRKAEAQWLVQRVKEEIARSKKIAPPEFLAEYQAALAAYEEIEKRAE